MSSVIQISNILLVYAFTSRVFIFFRNVYGTYKLHVIQKKFMKLHTCNIFEIIIIGPMVCTKKNRLFSSVQKNVGRQNMCYFY